MSPMKRKEQYDILLGSYPICIKNELLKLRGGFSLSTRFETQTDRSYGLKSDAN